MTVEYEYSTRINSVPTFVVFDDDGAPRSTMETVITLMKRTTDSPDWPWTDIAEFRGSQQNYAASLISELRKAAVLPGGAR